MCKFSPLIWLHDKQIIIDILADVKKSNIYFDALKQAFVCPETNEKKLCAKIITHQQDTKHLNALAYYDQHRKSM